MTDDTHHYCDDALKAAGIKPSDRDENLIRELAQMSELAYQKRREEAAAQLGIRVTILDKIVHKQRAKPSQGRKVEVTEIEPWGEPVDGADLLDEMSAAILEHIVLAPEQADTVALFSLYTHAYQVFKVAPRLGVRAPTRECGKSELLLRIQRFVLRPLATENLTGPVLFRLIEGRHPTLFIDEFDNLLSEGKSELLGLLNSGYARDGKSHRLEGDNFELREFSTFSPLVYGMIGKPRDNFNSRSIPIEMRRATPSEWRALLSLEDGEAEDLRLLDMGRKAARWARDNLDRLKAARPNMLPMVNRPATNWRPLFAVAEVAGETWLARAKAAAAMAGRLKQTPVEEEELFAVIKATFLTRTNDYIEAEALARALAEVESGPWAEYGKTGKPITSNALARLLRRFGIGPGQVGPKHARKRGYTREQFDEVFASYAPETPTPFTEGVSKCPPVHHAVNPGTSAFRNCPPENPAVDGCEVEKPAKNGPGGRLDGCKGGVSDVCVSEAPSGPENGPGLCAQCRGEEGAPAVLHRGAGYPPEGVWLHRECVRFWSPKASAAPPAKVESASTGHSDPWADLDIPAYLDRTRARQMKES
jgi:putative DNA primase/helicase